MESVKRKQHEHGTVQRYRRNRCRCERCVAANTQARKDWEAKKVKSSARAHGTVQRYWQGCRCDACAAASTEHQRNREARKTGRVKPRRTGEVIHTHGTAARYRKGKCRCELCVAANTQARRDWEAKHGDAAPRSPREHGTVQRRWQGCRCDACRAAYNAYVSDRRRRQ